MAGWKKILLAGDAETEVEAADPLALAGDVTIVGAGKSLEVLDLRFETASTKTIDTDEFTRDQVYHLVAGEGAAADDLDGIGGGADGMLLLIRPSDDAVTITVKHNDGGATAGNVILLANDLDCVLDDEDDTLFLIYDAALDSANGAWVEIARGGGGDYTDADAVAAVEAAGLVLDSTKVYSSADEDLANLLGRAWVGYNGADADEAGFGHRDMADAGAFAIKQTAAGATIVNAEDGQTLAMAVHDTNVVEVVAAGVSVKKDLTVIAGEALVLAGNATCDSTATGAIFYDSDDDHLYVYQP